MRSLSAQASAREPHDLQPNSDGDVTSLKLHSTFFAGDMLLPDAAGHICYDLPLCYIIEISLIMKT